MSHVTVVKSVIRSLDALRDALRTISERHGVTLTLSEGAGDVRYYMSTARADHVVKVPDERYDMGFTRQSDDTYSLVCDTEALTGGYGRGATVRKLFGDHADVLLQEYAVSALQRTAMLEGHTATRGETRADGSVVLTVRR